MREMRKIREMRRPYKKSFHTKLTSIDRSLPSYILDV